MPAKPEGVESERVQLAQLALGAALAQRGVTRAESGPGLPRLTATPSEVLTGVAVSATADGQYEVNLRLVAELVPLAELADRVRARVATAAKRQGLAGVAGAVNIEFVDLALPDDPAPSTNHGGQAPEGPSASAPPTDVADSEGARGRGAL